MACLAIWSTSPRLCSGADRQFVNFRPPGLIASAKPRSLAHAGWAGRHRGFFRRSIRVGREGRVLRLQMALAAMGAQNFIVRAAHQLFELGPAVVAKVLEDRHKRLISILDHRGAGLHLSGRALNSRVKLAGTFERLPFERLHGGHGDRTVVVLLPYGSDCNDCVDCRADCVPTPATPSPGFDHDILPQMGKAQFYYSRDDLASRSRSSDPHLKTLNKTGRGMFGIGTRIWRTTHPPPSCTQRHSRNRAESQDKILPHIGPGTNSGSLC